MNTVRSLLLALLAAVLAVTMWGATLLASPHSADGLSQKPNLELQTADGGGGRPNG
jgi:hypothetical protein